MVKRAEVVPYAATNPKSVSVRRAAGRGHSSNDIETDLRLLPFAEPDDCIVKIALSYRRAKNKEKKKAKYVTELSEARVALRTLEAAPIGFICALLSSPLVKSIFDLR